MSKLNVGYVKKIKNNCTYLPEIECVACNSHVNISNNEHYVCFYLLPISLTKIMNPYKPYIIGRVYDLSFET